MIERLQHVFVDQASEPFGHRTVSAGVLQRGEEGGEREMPSQLCEDTGKKCKLIPFAFKVTNSSRLRAGQDSHRL